MRLRQAYITLLEGSTTRHGSMIHSVNCTVTMHMPYHYPRGKPKLFIDIYDRGGDWLGDISIPLTFYGQSNYDSCRCLVECRLEGDKVSQLFLGIKLATRVQSGLTAIAEPTHDAKLLGMPQGARSLYELQGSTEIKARASENEYLGGVVRRTGDEAQDETWAQQSTSAIKFDEVESTPSDSFVDSRRSPDELRVSGIPNFDIERSVGFRLRHSSDSIWNDLIQTHSLREVIDAYQLSATTDNLANEGTSILSINHDIDMMLRHAVVFGHLDRNCELALRLSRIHSNLWPVQPYGLKATPFQELKLLYAYYLEQTVKATGRVGQNLKRLDENALDLGKYVIRTKILRLPTADDSIKIVVAHGPDEASHDPADMRLHQNDIVFEVETKGERWCCICPIGGEGISLETAVRHYIQEVEAIKLWNSIMGKLKFKEMARQWADTRRGERLYTTVETLGDVSDLHKLLATELDISRQFTFVPTLFGYSCAVVVKYKGIHMYMTPLKDKQWQKFSWPPPSESRPVVWLARLQQERASLCSELQIGQWNDKDLQYIEFAFSLPGNTKYTEIFPTDFYKILPVFDKLKRLNPINAPTTTHNPALILTRSMRSCVDEILTEDKTRKFQPVERDLLWQHRAKDWSMPYDNFLGVPIEEVKLAEPMTIALDRRGLVSEQLPNANMERLIDAQISKLGTILNSLPSWIPVDSAEFAEMLRAFSMPLLDSDFDYSKSIFCDLLSIVTDPEARLLLTTELIARFAGQLRDTTMKHLVFQKSSPNLLLTRDLGILMSPDLLPFPKAVSQAILDIGPYLANLEAMGIGHYGDLETLVCLNILNIILGKTKELDSIWQSFVVPWCLAQGLGQPTAGLDRGATGIKFSKTDLKLTTGLMTALMHHLQRNLQLATTQIHSLLKEPRSIEYPVQPSMLGFEVTTWGNSAITTLRENLPTMAILLDCCPPVHTEPKSRLLLGLSNNAVYWAASRAAGMSGVDRSWMKIALIERDLNVALTRSNRLACESRVQTAGHLRVLMGRVTIRMVANVEAVSKACIDVIERTEASNRGKLIHNDSLRVYNLITVIATENYRVSASQPLIQEECFEIERLENLYWDGKVNVMFRILNFLQCWYNVSLGNYFSAVKTALKGFKMASGFDIIVSAADYGDLREFLESYCDMDAFLRGQRGSVHLELNKTAAEILVTIGFILSKQAVNMFPEMWDTYKAMVETIQKSGFAEISVELLKSKLDAERFIPPGIEKMVLQCFVIGRHNFDRNLKKDRVIEAKCTLHLAWCLLLSSFLPENSESQLIYCAAAKGLAADCILEHPNLRGAPLEESCLVILGMASSMLGDSMTSLTSWERVLRKIYDILWRDRPVQPPDIIEPMPETEEVLNDGGVKLAVARHHERTKFFNWYWFQHGLKRSLEIKQLVAECRATGGIIRSLPGPYDGALRRMDVESGLMSIWDSFLPMLPSEILSSPTRFIVEEAVMDKFNEHRGYLDMAGVFSRCRFYEATDRVGQMWMNAQKIRYLRRSDIIKDLLLKSFLVGLKKASKSSSLEEWVKTGEKYFEHFAVVEKIARMKADVSNRPFSMTSEFYGLPGGSNNLLWLKNYPRILRRWLLCYGHALEGPLSIGLGYPDVDIKIGQQGKAFFIPYSPLIIEAAAGGFHQYFRNLLARSIDELKFCMTLLDDENLKFVRDDSIGLISIFRTHPELRTPYTDILASILTYYG